MIVDAEQGIAGDTELFGKRLAAVTAGGFFQPPAKYTVAQLLEELPCSDRRPPWSRLIEITKSPLAGASMAVFWFHIAM